MTKRYIFSSVTVLLMFGTLLFFQVKNPITKSRDQWTSDKQREYANLLKSKGLNSEAVAAYEKYLSMENIPAETQANIYYIIGKIAEESGEYEKALAYYYKIDIAAPNSNLKQEIGSRIVSCLERTGRGIDAQNALDARTSLDKKEKPEGKLVARIGKDMITDTEINNSLQGLPKSLQEEYSRPEKRNELVRQYLATEILWRKAKRLGYEKDSEIRRSVDEISKQLIVQKLVDNEMNEKLQATPDQLDLYFRANKDKYSTPEKKDVSFDEVKDKVTRDYSQEQMKVIYKDLVEDAIKSEDVEIYEKPIIEKTKTETKAVATEKQDLKAEEPKS